VMPGYIGTNIVGNSMRAHGLTDEAEIEKANAGWQENAPTSAAEAAAVILDGVRSGAWRILVGEDAQRLDEFVRANPESTYDHEKRIEFLDR
jgi:hypothetical protein